MQVAPTTVFPARSMCAGAKRTQLDSPLASLDSCTHNIAERIQIARYGEGPPIQRRISPSIQPIRGENLTPGLEEQSPPKEPPQAAPPWGRSYQCCYQLGG